MKLSQDQKKRFLTNLYKFSAPLVAIFFAQLAVGVNWKQAGLVALYAFYAATADFLKKAK